MAPRVYVTQLRNLEYVHMKNRPDPVDLNAPCGHFIFGPTGCGKTQFAKRFAATFGSVWAKKSHSNKWFDKYNFEDAIVMNDMDPYHPELHGDIKLWLDSEAFPAEVKGKMMVIRPKAFIITSQVPLC